MDSERTFSSEDIKAKVDAIRERSRGQKDRAPLEHYLEEFAAADPEEIAARTGVAFDAQSQRFKLRFVGRPTTVSWPGLDVVDCETGQEARTSQRILLACFLLHGRLADATGKYLSYPEIPWGEHYYGAFRGRCIGRLAGTFGKRIDAFREKCERIGATPTGEGDASYDVEIVDGVFMRLTLWEGDEEFPANAQITFSDNAPLAFAAEELAAAGDVVIGAVSRA